MATSITHRRNAGRDRVALLSLIAYIIVSLGRPISMHPPGKASKRNRLLTGSAASLPRDGRSNHTDNQQTPSHGEQNHCTVVGFMTSDQPRVQTETSHLPQLLETLAHVPVESLPLSGVSRSPDTPPPRPFIS